MDLRQRIETDMKIAMKAKDKVTLQTLRSIKSLILLEATKGGATVLDEEGGIALLKRAAKQRNDSAEIFQKEGRPELAADELAELEIIERYLPQMLSDEDIKKGVQAAITELGATSMRDMGKVMKTALAGFGGRADNKVVSQMVKELLG
jgi:uncharacterized protein YqeY